MQSNRRERVENNVESNILHLWRTQMTLTAALVSGKRPRLWSEE